MRRQLLPALGVLLAMTVLTGLLYPLIMTGAAQAVMGHRADGSLITRDGEVVGSELIGQDFTYRRHFWPRPSAAGDGYDGMSSSASNLGPSSPDLLDAVGDRADAYRRAHGLDQDDPVPVDAVTASASGLDPHISVANARIQARRVARARGMDRDDVLRLVEEHTDHRALGFLGEDGVNVLELNLALDDQ